MLILSSDEEEDNDVKEKQLDNRKVQEQSNNSLEVFISRRQVSETYLGQQDSNLLFQQNQPSFQLKNQQPAESVNQVSEKCQQYELDKESQKEETKKMKDQLEIQITELKVEVQTLKENQEKLIANLESQKIDAEERFETKVKEITLDASQKIEEINKLKSDAEAREKEYAITLSELKDYQDKIVEQKDKLINEITNLESQVQQYEIFKTSQYNLQLEFDQFKLSHQNMQDEWFNQMNLLLEAERNPSEEKLNEMRKKIQFEEDERKQYEQGDKERKIFDSREKVLMLQKQSNMFERKIAQSGYQFENSNPIQLQIRQSLNIKPQMQSAGLITAQSVKFIVDPDKEMLLSRLQVQGNFIEEYKKSYSSRIKQPSTENDGNYNNYQRQDDQNDMPTNLPKQNSQNQPIQQQNYQQPPARQQQLNQQPKVKINTGEGGHAFILQLLLHSHFLTNFSCIFPKIKLNSKSVSEKVNERHKQFFPTQNISSISKFVSEDVVNQLVQMGYESSLNIPLKQDNDGYFRCLTIAYLLYQMSHFQEKEERIALIENFFSIPSYPPKMLQQRLPLNRLNSDEFTKLAQQTLKNCLLEWLNSCDNPALQLLQNILPNMNDVADYALVLTGKYLQLFALQIEENQYLSQIIEDVMDCQYVCDDSTLKFFQSSISNFLAIPIQILLLLNQDTQFLQAEMVPPNSDIPINLSGLQQTPLNMITLIITPVTGFIILTSQQQNTIFY